MSRKLKLLEKARNSPKNLSFGELQLLTENAGFELQRVRGSHHIYIHRLLPRDTPVSLQPVGKGQKDAKAYQVRQVLAKIDELLEINPSLYDG